MSTQIDLGPVLSVPKGDWNATTTYERLNIVRHNSASWICNVATSKGVEPAEGSTDWYLQVKDTSSVSSVNGMKGDVEITSIQTPSNDSNDTSIANTEWVRDRIDETINSTHSYTDSAISTATTSILDTAAKDASNKATIAVNQALAASETKFATKEIVSDLANNVSTLAENNAAQDEAINSAQNSADAASQQVTDLDSTLRALIAQEVAKCLKLTGGTMTDSLRVPNILRGQKDSTLGIYGGDAWREGAYLELAGPNAEYPNAFNLRYANSEIVGTENGLFFTDDLYVAPSGVITSSVNNALTVSRNSGETVAVRANNTNTGKAIRFGVGASGARGIYDESSASWLISYSASSDKLMSKGANVHTSADGLLLNDSNVQLWWAAEATLPAGGTWKVIGFCSSMGSGLDSTICNRYAGGSTVRMTKNSSEMFILAIRIA